MGLLDLFMSPDDPATANGSQDAPFQIGGLSSQTSDRLLGTLGAVGQSMLAGNRYQWFNPQVLSAALKEQGHEADRAQQRAAIKAILRRANPSLSEDQLNVMSADPQTARLALAQETAQAEAQASVKAGEKASGILGGLFGGGGSGAPSAGGSASGGSQIPGTLSLNDSDADTAIRTVLAEAGNQGPEGMQAVAGVLRNRALLAGTGVSAEALKPNQFEPWNRDWDCPGLVDTENAFA